jgi:hypothetical protein
MTKTKSNHVILGIRHHGPGSARSVAQQLESIKPDAIALEWPDGSQDVLKHIAQEDITPPIAQIQYLKSEPQQVSLLPLADFSPEWQVMQFAHQHQIPLYPIDLPFSQQSQLSDATPSPAGTQAWARILKQTGFTSIESFWDHYFERETQSLEDFGRLSELMAEIRASETLSKLNATREAYMRLQLRKHLKNHNTLVTIVGAYHSPALQTLDAHRKSQDQKLMTGSRNKATITALIPFSYPRLAKASGYAAGVDAPRLYEIQFQYGPWAGERWIAETARLLRSEGFHVSPSEAQAAVDMSRQLADLRQMNIPGQNELLQAAQATLCHGQMAPFERIRQQALMGDKTGKVPENLISSPLIQEFLKRIRSLRLSKYWSPKNPSRKTPQKELDLRKPLHQKCSAFLHLLLLMQMSWAQKSDGGPRDRGSFKEKWFFYWDIDCEIQLFQWGTRSRHLTDLARELLRERWTDSYPLKKLIADLEHVLLAELSGISDPLLEQIEKQSATTDELLDIVPATSALFSIAAYGDVRELDKHAIGKIAIQLHAKICSLIPYQCQNLDDDLSRDLFEAFDRYSGFMRSQTTPPIQQPWQQALSALIENTTTDPRIAAWALRQLLDAEQLETGIFHTHFHRHLSTAHEPEFTAAWLEGLLTGSAALLLYHDALFEAVQDWIQTIPAEIFQQVLPVLNRTFADYTLVDRQALWQRIMRPESQAGVSFADQYRHFALHHLLSEK